MSSRTLRRAAWVSGVAFLLLALPVRFGLLTPLDASALLWVHGFDTDARTGVMSFISDIGAGAVAIPIAVAVLIYLRWRRRLLEAQWYLLATLVGWGMNFLLKFLVDRPRPKLFRHRGQGSWDGFPSGHTMMAVLVFGLGAWLVTRDLRAGGLRALVLALTAALILAIGVSRIYLGAHYPGDVVGALLAGVAWGALTGLYLRRKEEG